MMKAKSLKLLIFLLLASFVFSGCVINNKSITKNMEKKSYRVAEIIAFQGFQDQEYSKVKNVLEKFGAKVETFSTKLGKAQSKSGELTVDIVHTLDDLNVDLYDAVIFVGGPGAQTLFGDSTAHQIAKTTINKNKILGAICIAPAILANAGVLNGQNATIWTDPSDRGIMIKYLTSAGAIFIDTEVVISGNIITANGPQASEEFGVAISQALSTKN